MSKRARRDRDDVIPQKYMTEVNSYGNSPEDIARWKAARKKRFPKSKPPTNALSSHFSAYASESDEEEEEETKVYVMSGSTAGSEDKTKASKEARAAPNDFEFQKQKRNPARTRKSQMWGEEEFRKQLVSDVRKSLLRN